MVVGSENKKILSEINVINLVDVMLVLLIIFILVAPIMEHGIDVRLPATTPSEIRTPEDSLTVSLAPPGKIYLNNQRVTIDELKEKLREIARVNPETSLILRADEKLDYGLVIKVLDGIRNSGLNRIGIATRPRAD
jgi:biopolymer transport protein TolR